MTDKELIRTLREYADWADGNAWEVPLMLADHLRQAAEKLEQMPQWISVEERLPEIGEAVLVIASGWPKPRTELRSAVEIATLYATKPQPDWLLEAWPDWAEPEEITAMQHTLDEYHKVAAPLLRAQADGRLVVLPCKVGQRVFALLDTDKYISECDVKQIGMGNKIGFIGLEPIGAGAKRCVDFIKDLEAVYTEIAEIQQEDTPDMEYTKAVVDRRLKGILKDHFQPWDERYVL